MTKSTITRERLQEIAEDGFLKHGESKVLARMALAAMDSEPVAYRWNYGGTTIWRLLDTKPGPGSNSRCPRVIEPLYRHAQPAPVVPDAYVRDGRGAMMLNGKCEPRIGFGEGWNACRAAMLQAEPVMTANKLGNSPEQGESRGGNSPVNEATAGKSLTITLPDISSKAFWSGKGKTEVFHPETYKRWVKEAIERYCAIARVEVEVK